VDAQQLGLSLWTVWFVTWMILAFRTKRTVRKEDLSSRFLQLLAIVVAFSMVFSGFAKDTPLGNRFLPDTAWLGALGAVLTFIGLAHALWARFHLGRNWSGRVTIKEDHALIRSGPYRLSRHPIYTGILLAYLGSVLTLGEWRGLLGLAIISAAYVRKLRVEEVELEKHFGDAYRAFKRDVKALIPFLF
jgi:protein-S-isoprenylcysteine O-methyltransferase Ste14